jgi:hypothetical protein
MTTFGNNNSKDVARISFDWPDYWEQHRSPQLQVVVRVTGPTTPSYTQVQYIQGRINERMEREFPGLQLQTKVHRINMTIISGNDVTSEPTKLNLELILGQEMIQKTTPQGPGNKAEAKVKIDNDINSEPLSIRTQQFNPISYTHLKIFRADFTQQSLYQDHENLCRLDRRSILPSPIRPTSAQITDI